MEPRTGYSLSLNLFQIKKHPNKCWVLPTITCTEYDLHLGQTFQVHCLSFLIWNQVSLNIPKNTVITFYRQRVHWKCHIIWSPQWTSENHCSRASSTKRSAFHLQRGVLFSCSAPERTPVSSGQVSTLHQRATCTYPTTGFQNCPVNMHFVAGKGKEPSCLSCQEDNGASNFWVCLRKV